MKKLILMSLIFCCKISFCPDEAYTVAGDKIEQHTNLEQKEQTRSWLTNMQKKFSDTMRKKINDIRNRFSKTSIPETEPLQMQETAYDDEPTEENGTIFQSSKLPPVKYALQGSGLPAVDYTYDNPNALAEYGENEKNETPIVSQADQEKDILHEQEQQAGEEVELEKILKDPVKLQQLSIEQTANLNFSVVAPSVFSELSEESIKALLQNFELLTKLSSQQVQAITPALLSRVLKSKLSDTLSKSFVEKLSLKQIQQLLGDHVEWRWDNFWKNLGTNFKKNFTPDALDYMKNKETDLNEKVDFHNDKANEDAYLTNALAKLPEDKRPADINTAVEYMQEGKDLWDILKKGNLWSSQVRGKILSKIFEQIPNLSADQIDTLTKIFNGELPPDPNDPNFNRFMDIYQTMIIKLQWYFYKLSILEDGRAFEGGAITFEDKQAILFNFLENYARLISPDYKSFWKSWGTKAYKRTSSHFTSSNPLKKILNFFKGEDKNIGIDMVVPKVELGLPLNYPHLLFDQRKNGYVFVKWEPHGMSTLKDVLRHGLSFGKTFNENDESKHSKDRIPKNVKDEFWKTLYKGAKTTEIKEAVAVDGISKMLELLSPDARITFEKYLTQDRAKNPKLRNFQATTLSVRRGGEAIINPFQNT